MKILRGYVEGFFYRDLFSVIAVTGNINMFWGNVQWFYQRNSIFPVYVTKKYVILFDGAGGGGGDRKGQRTNPFNIELNIPFNIERFKYMWNGYTVYGTRS